MFNRRGNNPPRNEDPTKVEGIDGTLYDKNPRATLSGEPAAEGMEDAPAPQPVNPATGQHKDYWVLSEAERAKGFVRPVRRTYLHVGKSPKMDGCVLLKRPDDACGTRTSMNQTIAETYAADPKFYTSTFCCDCNAHLPVEQFIWEGTTERVGS